MQWVGKPLLPQRADTGTNKRAAQRDLRRPFVLGDSHNKDPKKLQIPIDIVGK